MMTQVEGKIFLAGQRGLKETDRFRTWYTFNHGDYFSACKQPFGNLYTTSDETYSGNYSTTQVVLVEGFILLLPVVGAVCFSIDGGEEYIVQAGELLCAAVKTGSCIAIANPYETELVNFIQLGLQANVSNAEVSITPFSFTAYPNKLIPLNIEMGGQAIRCYIGKFAGRMEEVCHPATGNSLFTYIIDGAFEVQNRLLERRDALALRHVSEMDMEALSNEAVVFIIEIPHD
ncbi:MAG: hypothetical protein EOP51_17255 [Sphingobacteriales bacterium]|nr:MAG: hypothetical protein EOP51_17255 [Sphingobacteriales bacterium]